MQSPNDYQAYQELKNDILSIRGQVDMLTRSLEQLKDMVKNMMLSAISGEQEERMRTVLEDVQTKITVLTKKIEEIDRALAAEVSRQRRQAQVQAQAQAQAVPIIDLSQVVASMPNTAVFSAFNAAELALRYGPRIATEGSIDVSKDDLYMLLVQARSENKVQLSEVNTWFNAMYYYFRPIATVLMACSEKQDCDINVGDIKLKNGLLSRNITIMPKDSPYGCEVVLSPVILNVASDNSLTNTKVLVIYVKPITASEAQTQQQVQGSTNPSDVSGGSYEDYNEE